MGSLSFICGGVRSGKSAYAEKLAAKYYQQYQRNIYYLASGVAFDEEMKRRIARHQEERNQTNIPWQTVEMIENLPTLSLTQGDIIFWDCVTTWLNNVLFATEQLEENVRLENIHSFIQSFQKNVLEWVNSGVKVILVSNELLDELPLDFEEVKLYRKLLGTLHQWIVSHSDEAYELDYSICVRRK